MFKKLKSIFSSEKDESQKDLPESAAAQDEVSESSPAESAEADAAVVAAPVVEKQEMETVTAVAEDRAIEESASVAVENEVTDTVVVEPESEPETEVVVEAGAGNTQLTASEVTDASPATPEPEPKTGFFGRIKAGLSRTKANLTEGLGDLFLGAKQIDDELLEEIETQLLMADVGVEATTEIIGKLTERVKRKQLADADALYTALKVELASLLETVEKPIDFSQAKGPFVLLMVGVNGVGKTTTIGKLAKKYQAEGKSVMLAAGDTFRAAAVEQLQVWGDRNNVPVVAQHTGADSASVLYDALQSAQAKNIDVLIADTAGRLQNKDNLMQELEKVVRVMKKLDPDAPHEVMLVLDAGTGQNAMSQARLFKEAVGVSGISLTKLDGTAKGGIIFAIAKQLDLPIRYIGVGEQVDDLRPFKAKEFVTALFD